MATDIREPSLEIPPLRPGDRLTRAEFERRWEAMPQVKRAELIDGEVIMPAAASSRHSGSHFDMIGWLAYYRYQTPGTEGHAEHSVRFDDSNEPQPDALLRIKESCGGRSRVDSEGYLDNGPELICEVALTSVAIDLGRKLHLYQRFGVQEYLVWRVADKIIDWFLLRNGRYERLVRSADRIFRSEVFPGLWLDADALTADDSQRWLAIAQRGLGSPEHAAFVAELLQRGGSTI